MNIKINTKDGVFNMPSTDGNTLLETLEINDIEAHYHCRDGFCGACRCKIKSGEVNYTIDPLAYIDDGEIFLCCTVPTTDIELSID